MSAQKRDAGRGQTSGYFNEVRLVPPVFSRVFRFSAEQVVKGARLAHHSMPVLYLHLRLINMQAFRPDNDGMVSLRNLIDNEVHFVFSLKRPGSHPRPFSFLWQQSAQRKAALYG
jgi:hypothetical protein